MNPLSPASSEKFLPTRTILLLLLVFLSIPASAEVGVYLDAQPNPVYIGALVKFSLKAESNVGVNKIFLEEVSAATIHEKSCYGSSTCQAEFRREFPSAGEFEFCYWATDASGQSPKLCLNVTAFTSSRCEAITLSDSVNEVVIATRIKSRKLSPEIDGFGGYPLECCPYCQDLEINLSNCQKLAGTFSNYQVIVYPVTNDTYLDLNFPQQHFPPQTQDASVLCHSEPYPGIGVLGIVDDSNYLPLDFIYSEEKLKYWFVQVNDGQQDRYFPAEIAVSLETEEKEVVVVDSAAYSNIVNTLMSQEEYLKQPESIECNFDCVPGDDCSSTSGCDAPCSRINECGEVGCCPECQQVYYYSENVYQKYAELWGRPYTDYLFCYRTPLKNTAWCQQRLNLPTSAINYPWYSFEVKDKLQYSSRDLGTMPQEYIDDAHEWNAMQQIQEMPDRAVIKHVTRAPETDCHHNFDSKLFRTVWTKIFTVTPFLNDERNHRIWSRTGEGAVYAGGGFRREPACWWECCRMCGPMCNWDCSPCCNFCNLNAYFTSGVTNVMRFTIPDIKIYPSAMTITQNAPNQVTVSNGALSVISTGNRPFVVSSAQFGREHSLGVFTLTQVYTPTPGGLHPPERAQFVITQDIVFKYDLRETADMLAVQLEQEFSTTLNDDVCLCIPGDTCPCTYVYTKTIETSEYVTDLIGEGGSMNMKKIEALKEAANGFVDQVISRMQVGLAAFSQWTPIGTSGASCPGRCPNGVCSSLPLTFDGATIHSQINSYMACDGTCIACGVHKGIELLSAVPGEKYIILFSDGVPNCCYPGGGYCGEPTAKTQAEDAVKAAASQGITVHTVALGNAAAISFMKKLAKLGNGTAYDVNCDCMLNCIYRDLSTRVDNAVILVNDVSGSMDWPASINCPSTGPPVIHENILRDFSLSVNGRIDSYEGRDEFITHRGFLEIVAFPDIISKFVLTVKNSTLEYSSLKYPVQHKLYRKEFGHGVWAPGYPYTPLGPIPGYGYLPAYQSYRLTGSYGYESRIPTAVGFEFSYLPQAEKICPSNCFCPAYDLTDVTCIDYTQEPPRYYSRSDCVCPERDQAFLRPFYAPKSYHSEEFYYYDFVDYYTLEIDTLVARDTRYKEKPLAVTGGSLSGNVTHLVETLITATTTTTPTILCASAGLPACLGQCPAGEGCVDIGGICGCREETTTTTLPLQPIDTPGYYFLDFTVMQFPQTITMADLLDANLTVFIHFRNNTRSQTYSLFPPRNETIPPDHKTSFLMNVGTRGSSQLAVESVQPGKYNLKPETNVKVQVWLFNPPSQTGIANQRITAEVEGYGISQTLLTDSSGRVTLSLLLSDQSAKINFIFNGTTSYVPSRVSTYCDVVSLGRIWWFLSPEVLLLLIVLVSLAFFYRWFRGGRLDIEEIKKEFKGENEE